MIENIPYLAFLAPFALFFQQVRGFISQLFSFLIRNDSIEINPNAFICFMKSKSLEIKIGNLQYKPNWAFSKKESKYKNVWFTFRLKYIFLYKNYIPLIITPIDCKCNILYFNFFNFKSLLIESIDYIEKEDKKDIYNRLFNFKTIEIKGESIKEKLSASSSYSNSPSSGSTLESRSSNNSGLSYVSYRYLLSTPPIGEKIENVASCAPLNDNNKYYFSKEGINTLKRVESWLSAQPWYEKRQINWKLSCLIYGVPGTGKSQLILEIAKKLGRTLYKVDLTDMTNKELEFKLKSIEYGSIVLFEDLDCQFKKREFLHKTDNNPGLSFDYFINILSGVNCLKNCFVFATTNHIEDLDEALLRPGRFDFKIEIPPICKEGKQFIAEKMLDLWPEEIYNVVNKEVENETVAEYELRVTEKALELYWKDNLLKN